MPRSIMRLACAVGLGAAFVMTLSGSPWLSSVSAAGSDKCVAVNGEVRMQQGTSTTCVASEGALVLAIGNNNTATADGDGNRIRIKGDGRSPSGRRAFATPPAPCQRQKAAMPAPARRPLP